MKKREFSMIGLGVALVLFLAINMASSATLKSARLDLTENGLFTLSQGTKNILGALDETVTVRFYFSKRAALEYAGLKVIIGGDTFPNKWFIKYAVNADLAIHETFLTQSVARSPQ